MRREYLEGELGGQKARVARSRITLKEEVCAAICLVDTLGICLELGR